DRPDAIASIAVALYRPEVLPVADGAVGGDPAVLAGLRPGDRIVRVDGVAIESWAAGVEYVRARPGQALAVEVAREGQVLALSLTPRVAEQPDGTAIGQVGMAVRMPEWPPGLLRQIDYGPLEALGAAAHQTWKTTGLVLDSIQKMITGLISPKHLSGPITIAKVAGPSRQDGVAPYPGFLAPPSLNLRVPNLLP